LKHVYFVTVVDGVFCVLLMHFSHCASLGWDCGRLWLQHCRHCGERYEDEVGHKIILTVVVVN